MPPKKKTGTSTLTQFFDKARNDTPTTRGLAQAATMSLTREDLMSSLKEFRQDLRADIEADMEASFESFRTEVREKLTSMQTDVDSIGTRALDLETQYQDMEPRLAHVEEGTSELRNQLQATMLKCEDLENRSRRDNIRVRGLEEDCEGPDLEAFMVGLFSTILGDEAPAVSLERVHRVGPRNQGSTRPPRDILAKFSSFKVKEKVLQKARSMSTVSFQNATCTLYQDVAQATLQRRHQFRPVTTFLRDKQIRYRWTFPFGLVFQWNTKTYRCEEVQEAMTILGLEPPELPTEGTNPAGQTSRQNRSTWRQIGRRLDKPTG